MPPHKQKRRNWISIHALLAESDPLNIQAIKIAVYFYPRSPCGERRHRTVNIQSPTTFLSTLSLRRATCARCHCWGLNEFLSTLSLRRATVRRMPLIRFCPDFYPRSPCGERRGVRLSCFGRIIFLSTLSLRRATLHAKTGKGQSSNFYPRSPCGERPIKPAEIGPNIIFLSTLSLRRATLRRNADCNCHNISIHALLAESDPLRRFGWALNHNFYPRSPCGERLTGAGVGLYLTTISIHALLAESDVWPTGNQPSTPGFLSTLSLRRATIY